MAAGEWAQGHLTSDVPAYTLSTTKLWWPPLKWSCGMRVTSRVSSLALPSALFSNSDRIITFTSGWEHSSRTERFNNDNKVATCISKGKIWKQREKKKKRPPNQKDGPLKQSSIHTRGERMRDSHLKRRPSRCFYRTPPPWWRTSAPPPGSTGLQAGPWGLPANRERNVLESFPKWIFYFALANRIIIRGSEDLGLTQPWCKETLTFICIQKRTTAVFIPRVSGEILVSLAQTHVSPGQGPLVLCLPCMSLS